MEHGGRAVPRPGRHTSRLGLLRLIQVFNSCHMEKGDSVRWPHLTTEAAYGIDDAWYLPAATLAPQGI